VYKWQYKKLENAFYHAKQRCNDPTHPRYNDWGGRGIQFRFSCLQDFISCIGIPTNTDWILDRINNEGNYEVGNIRWVRPEDSSRNRRLFKTNISGQKGVSLRKDGTWSAQAWLKGKQIHLYQGPSIEDAIKARQLWEKLNYKGN
jgi:hypothetical protein